MKKIKILAIAVAAAALSSCAKDPGTATNQNAVLYFRSWVEAQKAVHPEYLWERTQLGCYILEETAGTGAPVGTYEDSPYLYLTYTIRDLDGTITQTCDVEDAKLSGKYNGNGYFGPTVIYRGGNALYAGLEEVFPRMKEGGSCRFVMPGWLTSSSRYSTEQKYIDKVTGDDAIYQVKVHKAISDIVAWELDSLENFVTSRYGAVDTVRTGFYYIQTQAPSDTTDFNEGQSVYLDYTGSLLNGTVFDTTVERRAKDAGIYNSSKTYGSTYVTWNREDATKITLGSDESSVIEGFALTISRMKTGEKGIGIFYSSLGYGTKSVDNIPAYSPLVFEIELKGTEK